MIELVKAKTKAQQIREYVAANPKATPTQIAEAMSVNRQYVYTVMYKVKAKALRLPKKVYVAAAIVLFAAGGVTTYALIPESEPARVEVQQVASTQPEQEPLPVQEQTAPVEEPVAEPEPEPVETVESVLAEQNWNQFQRDNCVSVILTEKPEYFKDVETTKKTLKGLPNPCYLLRQGESDVNGTIIVPPTVDKVKWYYSVDRKLGNPPPNQQTAQ